MGCPRELRRPGSRAQEKSPSKPVHQITALIPHAVRSRARIGGLGRRGATASAGLLERGRIGETWRGQRWDSFLMNTPNRAGADHHRIEDGARDHFQHSKPASTHSDPCSAGSDRARGAFVPGKGIWPLGLMSQASRRYYFTSASYTNKVDLSSSGMKYARRPESPASTQTGFCVIGRPDGDHSSTGT